MLRQVDSSYVSDSVEVLSALIIIAQTSLFKSPQPFIIFVNYERAYFVEKFLHIPISYFALAKKRRNKKERYLIITWRYTQQTFNVDSTLIYVEITSRRRLT